MTFFKARKKLLQRQLKGAKVAGERRRRKAVERAQLQQLKSRIRKERGVKEAFDTAPLKSGGRRLVRGLGVIGRFAGGVAQNVGRNLSASATAAQKPAPKAKPTRRRTVRKRRSPVKRRAPVRRRVRRRTVKRRAPPKPRRRRRVVRVQEEPRNTGGEFDTLGSNFFNT